MQQLSRIASPSAIVSLLCNVVRVHKARRVNAISTDLVSISTLQEADQTRARPCQVQPYCLLYAESNDIVKARPEKAGLVLPNSRYPIPPSLS